MSTAMEKPMPTSVWRIGYDPDLIGVVASNGMSGYLLKNDFRYNGYPAGTTDEGYMPWLAAQPKVLKFPVYDVDRDNIVGYFETTNTVSSQYRMTQEEFKWQLEVLEQGLRSSGWRTEEEIAQELENFRANTKIAPPEMTLDELREAYGW